jgi:carbamoyltransferase
MKVLGINANVHDSSVCLIEDGRVAYAVEEERLNHQKHFGGFPERALARALEWAGGMAQVDLVVHPWQPWRFYREELSEHLPRCLSSKAFLHLHQLCRSHDEMAQYLMIDRRFRKDPAVRRYATCGHHLAHAASAFFASPFEEAAVLTYDARGEDVATVLWEGRSGRLRELRRFRLPHSLGHLYAMTTRYLGFASGDEEYKVMGLAAYGKPAHKDWFDLALSLLPDGGYRLSREHLDFYRGFTRGMLALGPPCKDGHRPDQRQMDIAASLQARFEEAALHLARWLRSETGMRNLCIAGGCGLNGVANGRLAREAGFEEVWVQPAAHDTGLSLGAALWGWHALLGGKRSPPMDRADFGDAFEGEAVTRTLDRCKIPYRTLEDPAREAAGLIASGRIVGWVQGRAEFGPRALGNRSILADPGLPDMKDRMNAVIKQREAFRPFAPACREEDVARYFEWGRPLPFMVFVFPVRREFRGRLPAVTHVDGSARIQTVRRDVNERFWSLLGHLEALTGLGVVLNTSFNLQGEPIVNDPADALRTFYASGMDALILDRYLVTK